MSSKVKAAIMSCVLLAMASNSYAAGEVTVTRDLPDYYVPGENVTVTLIVDVEESNPPVNFGIEDTFPAGWTYVVGSANPDHHNTSSDVEAEHRLGWLFWSGGLTVRDTVITYVVTPPAEETGTKTFSGKVPVENEPVDEIVGGDTEISRPAAQLAFTAQPVGPYQAGETINAIPQITVQDSSGNTVTSSTASITLAIKTGTGTPGATLSGTKTVNAVDGVATFSGLSVDLTGTGYQLTATSEGLTSADSDAFDVIASTPIRLAFITSPGDGAAGAELSPAPVVAVQDNYGNTATSYTAEVTVAIKGETGTLSGAATVPAVSGVATFPGLSIKPEGMYQLTATSGGLASADSDPFTLTGIPALTIEKLDDADPVSPNTDVTYTITYGNVGLGDASNTVIVETLPTNLLYVGTIDGGVYDDTTRTITWTVGTLNAETTGDIIVCFTARVANSGSILEGGIITNSELTIDCDETDPVEQTTAETTKVNDKKAPETSGHIPEKDSIQAPRDTIVQLHITDGGSGVKYDGGTVTIQIEGDLIYDGANETSPGVYDSNSLHPEQTIKGICRRVGSEADYTFTFQASTMFDYEQKVDVTVDAEDKAGNAMAQENYYFYTVMRSFGRNAKVNSDTGSLVQDHPATATDSAGNVWVIWDAKTATDDGDIYIGQLKVGASAFEPNIPVTTDENNQSDPAIAIDGSDVIYATWQERNPADPNSKWNIFTSTSADGINWSLPVHVDPCDANQGLPAIAIDRATPNKAYIAWEDDREGNNDIFVASSTNGIDWDAKPITTHATDQTEPAIAIDRLDDVAYVAWTDARNDHVTDIYGACFTDGTWTTPMFVVNTVSNQSSPAVAAFGAEGHLLWVDDTDPNGSVFYAATTDGLQGPLLVDPNVVDERAYSQREPAIAVLETGASAKVFACWQDARNVVNNNADTDIYFAESSSDFGTNILVNDDVGTNTQTAPVIGIDKNGNPYIVWVDNRNGNNDIYYTGATCVGLCLGTTTRTSAEGHTVIEVNADSSCGQIDDVNDVVIDIPGTVPGNVNITISKIHNLPEPPPGGFGVCYDFGPSGLTFDPPVTICIPHLAEECPGYPVWRVYWYDPDPLRMQARLLAGLPELWSQNGISDVEHMTDADDPNIPTDLHILRFKSTHLTSFGQGGSQQGGGGGGGGGGGCTMSPYGQGNVAEFLLPYIAYIMVLLAISWVDARRRRKKCSSQ